MPLNPNLALVPMQGVQAQGNAIDKMFNTYYKSAGNARQNALFDLQKQNTEFSQGLQTDANNRANESHALTMEAGEFKIDQAQGEKIYRAFEGFDKLSPETRQAQIDFMMPELSKFGFDADDVDMLMNDPQQAMAIMERFKPVTDGQGYFAPTAALDADGNPVFVQGSKGGGLNKLDGFTPMKETPAEASTRKIKEAEALADIDAEKDITKLTGRAKTERIIKVIDTGIAAAEILPTYDRMLELVDAVNTGGIQSGLQSAKQLFGWGAADIGELNALFKESVLSNIRKMGSNPTEGERTFLIEASGGIDQSPEVLKRLLKRRRDESLKAVEKGKKWATDQEDHEALDLMGGAGNETSASTADQAALEWAQANPDDPRAQQIMQIQGGQ
jgi:hypothetical protein